MNILFLTVECVGKYVGGVERVCYNLNESFEKIGYNSISCSLHENKSDSKSFRHQFCLPDNQDITSEINVKFLTDLVVSHKIDIIFNHSCHIHAMLELIIKTKEHSSFKLVTVYHTDVSAPLKEMIDKYQYLKFKYSGVKLRIKRLYHGAKYPIGYYLRGRSISQGLRQIYNNSDAFVLLSEFYKPPFMKNLRLDSAPKLYAINNPINENDLPQGGIVDSNRKNQILFVGRLEFQKRVDRLLDIWQGLHLDYPDWELVVIGDGTASNKMKEYAKQLKLERVKFLGSVPSTNYYSESKILCMTSSYEGFPMVLIEAQQYGCVPVAYESFEAIRDVIDNGVNGYLVPPFKKRAFAEQLTQLMDNEELRYQISENAVKSVTKFASETIVKQWDDLFQKLT